MICESQESQKRFPGITTEDTESTEKDKSRQKSDRIYRMNRLHGRD